MQTNSMISWIFNRLENSSLNGATKKKLLQNLHEITIIFYFLVTKKKKWRKKTNILFVFFLFTDNSEYIGNSNSNIMTPSAKIQALNIVADLLRRVNVSCDYFISLKKNQFLFSFSLSASTINWCVRLCMMFC